MNHQTTIRPKKDMHGMSKAKGCNHLQLGTFCKMFPGLSSWADDFGIEGKTCEAEKIASILGGVNSIMHENTPGDSESGIPAAYTFFAQFIDHDITLDTTSQLHGPEIDQERLATTGCPMHKINNPGAPLPNLRSASLDLDCVYGFGPEASPYLYDPIQAGRLLVGSARNENDVPRNEAGTALIGDPRNDENIFVSQMQLMFLKFHNKRLIGKSFEKAREDVKYHYQYLVLHDFLKRVCDEKIYNYVMKEIEKKQYPKFDILDHHHRICMPVEFSVAAYRFGHTMVRSVYPVNVNNPAIELFDERFNTLGFSGLPEELTVDWSYLLDVDPCQQYANSKAIDHLLTDELIRMPDSIVGNFAPENDRSLAFRNLLRGFVLTLPSGQKVAEALDEHYPINQNQDIGLADILKDRCVDKDLANKLVEHTPLFLYILCEAGKINKGQRLGPVGSALLLEVFGSMLVHCDSFLHKKDWKPDPCLTQNGDLTLASLVRYVGDNN